MMRFTSRRYSPNVDTDARFVRVPRTRVTCPCQIDSTDKPLRLCCNDTNSTIAYIITLRRKVGLTAFFIMAIGIFDSGIGGLTVLREIKSLLPRAHLIYLGDTARVPYGIRSSNTVTVYAMESARFLSERGIDMLVVACNTSSAVAMDALSDGFDVPVLGVIHPGAKAAVQTTKGGRVGVLGTPATISSNAYLKAIRQIDSGVSVAGMPCPLFVPLVEEGWLENEVARLTAREYLYRLYHADPDIDTIVLGCTHYPLLKPVLNKVSAGVFEGPVTLVDSALETARMVREMVEEKNIHTDEDGDVEYFVTDFPERFRNVGSMFLGEDIEQAEQVALPQYEE